MRFALQTLAQVTLAWLCCLTMVRGQQRIEPAPSADEEAFQKEVQPLLKEFCFRCHNADIMKSEVRLDDLTATPEAKQLPLWKKVATQLGDEAMPPEDQPKPSAEQRKTLSDWAERMAAMMQSRPLPKGGSIRRPGVARTLR